jgi:hypothetical protein
MTSEKLASYATIIGLPFLIGQIWLESRVRERDRISAREQILNAMRQILALMANWASANTPGYPRNPEFISHMIATNTEWRSPFHHIHPIANPLPGLISHPGMIYYPEDFRMAVVALNQSIVTLDAWLQRIYAFSDSDPTFSSSLNSKLRANIPLTKVEDQYVADLVNLYASLHLDAIGDANTGTLHFWHSEVSRLLAREEVRLRTDTRLFNNPVLKVCTKIQNWLWN